MTIRTARRAAACVIEISVSIPSARGAEASDCPTVNGPRCVQWDAPKQMARDFARFIKSGKSATDLTFVKTASGGPTLKDAPGLAEIVDAY